MKSRIFLLLLIVFPFYGISQINEKPVEWSFSQKQISKHSVLLVFEANIKANWHLYTQFFEDGGPIKLTFNFKESKDYKLIDKVTESPKPHKVKDNVFGINVQYIENNAVFTQKIKLLSDKKFVLSGSIEGQACSSVDGSCVMIYPEFKFKIKSK